MGHLALVVAWRSHYEQGYAVKHSDALVAFFAIGFSCVLTGEQVAVEESLQIGKVNAMILQISPTLTLVPGVHAGYCICTTHIRQGTNGLTVPATQTAPAEQ
jgi:hypothetical protein